MNKHKSNKKNEKEDMQRNSNWQGVDKSPGEEQGKKEKVTTRDLKAKKVDADPSKKTDRP